MQGRPDQRWSGRFAFALRDILLAINGLPAAFPEPRREEDVVRSDQQRRGDLRTTVLVPEAIIPHETARRPRWGLWMATLLAGMIAGLGLAWSFGFTRNQLKGHEAPLEASTPLPAPTPQSPYPSDLPDLSGRSTAPPAPSPPPVAPPVAPPELVPETPPVAVAPARPRELPEQRPPAPTPPPVTKIARLRPAPPTPVATHVEKPVPSERRSSPPTLPTPPTPPTPTERVDAAPRSARSLVVPVSGLFVPND